MRETPRLSLLKNGFGGEEAACATEHGRCRAVSDVRSEVRRTNTNVLRCCTLERDPLSVI